MKLRNGQWANADDQGLGGREDPSARAGWAAAGFSSATSRSPDADDATGNVTSFLQHSSLPFPRATNAANETHLRETLSETMC